MIESGLDILEGDLRAAALRGTGIRFLTSDYLGVTKPGAVLSIGPSTSANLSRTG